MNVTFDTLMARVVIDGDCWIWAGARTGSGYGAIWFEGRVELVHRLMYGLRVGPIPAGLELDHTCRNRACCRPSHLEAVTHQINVLRGIGKTAVNAAKTECVNGHPYDEVNTYIRPSGRPGRDCRVCRRARKAKLNTKVRAS